MIDMDWLAYVDVTRAFFPLLKRSKGRVVMIGSYGGYAGRRGRRAWSSWSDYGFLTAVPGWTTYNGVKAAIGSLLLCDAADR
jgi:NAD(P)-dependent dehydrogenase (short-subunit alcohol dehydrogenase family)